MSKSYCKAVAGWTTPRPRRPPTRRRPRRLPQPMVSATIASASGYHHPWALSMARRAHAPVRTDAMWTIKEGIGAMVDRRCGPPRETASPTISATDITRGERASSLRSAKADRKDDS
eukprot:scaffold262142_cov37-Tisochrysis_lutea.AAC.4